MQTDLIEIPFHLYKVLMNMPCDFYMKHERLENLVNLIYIQTDEEVKLSVQVLSYNFLPNFVAWEDRQVQN